MKFTCTCNAEVIDADNQPNKAHVLPDQDLYGFLEAIDRAIEQSGPSAEDKERACMEIRTLFSRLSFPVWQCEQCGCVSFDTGSVHLEPFLPKSGHASSRILRSRR